MRFFVLAAILAVVGIITVQKYRPEWLAPVVGPVDRLAEEVHAPAHVRRFVQGLNQQRGQQADQALGASAAKATKSDKPSASPATPKVPPPPRPRANEVTLLLANGGSVTGDLVSDTPAGVTLRWEYGDVTFARQEITRLIKGKQGTGDTDIVLPESAVKARQWKHAHDIVFRLLNGSILDAELVRATPEELILRQTVSGGGSVEQTIPRAQVDTVLCRPVESERSTAVRAGLETTFPKMFWYDEGCVTIITDSIKPSVSGYWRVIRELHTDFYLTFYPLLRGRRMQAQQFIVIFDNWITYIDYALTDGVPGWVAVGYFSPTDEVLYTFNMLGEYFSGLLYEAYLGKPREAIDRAVGTLAHGSRYDIFIEGLGLEIKAKFERLHAIVRAGYGRITEDTIRHELTHGLFHAWGLQTIVLSALSTDQQLEAQKKREYLVSTDMKKKRELLMELLNPESRQPLQLQASNSWVVEGLAGYMEPTPLGSVNAGRLHDVQQAARDHQVLPLEFLNTFRLGSFPGLTLKSQLYAYAQSWAFVHFLMQRHPQALLAFVQRLATQQGTQEQELQWLVAKTGTDLAGLEQQFRAYLDALPPQDPPWLEQFDALRQIFETF